MTRNKLEDNNLLDYYGVLLTQRQNEVLDLYLKEDFSMSEIADKLNISKTAVGDLLNRTYKIMDEYENKLHLIAQDSLRENIYSDILNKTDDIEVIKLVKKLQEIK